MASNATKLVVTKEQFEAAMQIREDGGTKKAQCEAIGIAYNTKRLDKLLDEYVDRIARTEVMKKQKRGTALTGAELAQVIQDYLEGDSLSELSERYYRSVGLIKWKLQKSGAIMKTNSKPDPIHPHLLPEDAVAEEFEIGERVFVAGYNCLGEIKAELPYSNGKAYRVYLLSADMHRYVNYPAYELGSLKHLEALGVNMDRLVGCMPAEDVKDTLNKALREAFKSRVKRDKG